MINKLKLLLKEKKLIIIYVLFCFIISAFYLKNLQIEKIELFLTTSNKNLIYLVYLIFCVIISIVVGILILFYTKSKKEIYIKFFVIALVIGTFYLFMTPFLRGADELAHFCRIYEISQGDLVTPISDDGKVGNELPVSLKEFHDLKNGKFSYSNIKDGLFFPLNSEERIDYENYYISISLYAPIQYLPQALGVFIGRCLNLSVYLIGMLGRITGFLFWLLVCTYALKNIPHKKMFFMLLLLSPICIGYATTLSGDMMLSCMCILLISKLYQFRCSKSLLRIKDIVFLAIICFIIALCKVVYIPIVFSVFLLPKDCFKRKKHYYIILLSICCISVILALGWFLYSNNFYLESFYSNSGLQKQYIISNPLSYIAVMVRTIFNYSMIYLTYSSQVYIYPIFSIIIWGIILVSLFNNETKQMEKFTLKDKFFFFGIACAIIVLVETAIYIQFTAMTASVGNGLVEGVQMRYFLPILFLFPIVVNKKRILIEDRVIFKLFLILQIPIFITIFINYL